MKPRVLWEGTVPTVGLRQGARMRVVCGPWCGPSIDGTQEGVAVEYQEQDAAGGDRWVSQDAGDLGLVLALALELEKHSPPKSELWTAALEALGKARQGAERWEAMNSAHEGFGVLLEEVDELKAHVWAKQSARDLAAMRAEALDVAAVALRIACEVCTEERGRR